MKIKELKESDSTLEIRLGEDFSDEVLTIGHFLSPKDNAVYFCKNKKFLERLASSFSKNPVKNIGLIVDKKFYENEKNSNKIFSNFSFIFTSPHVDLSISKISKPFYEEKYREMNIQVDGRQLGTAKIHPTARIAPHVFIGDKVEIGANTIIHANVTILPYSKIGDNTVIYPSVSIYHDVKIGNNVRIHSCVAIGGDGFGYNFADGQHHKVWHFGGVIIEDDVEIGASSAVDAGAFIPTRIGAGSKIDNMCTIGHNAQVGKGVIMVGMSGFAGSSIVGDYCVFAGRTATAPDTEIGAGSMVGAGAMMTTNWPAGSKISGHPARNHSEWLKSQAVLRKLTEGKK